MYGKRTQAVATAINAAVAQDVEAFVQRFRLGTMTVEVDGETLPIAGDMLTVAETPRSGWAVASAGADTVALDLELTHELRLAGLLRKVVRFVQDARKNAGLEVTDRIELWWRVGGSPEPAEAIRAGAAELAEEVLAVEVHEATPSPAEAHGCSARPTRSSACTIWLRNEGRAVGRDLDLTVRAGRLSQLSTVRSKWCSAAAFALAERARQEAVLDRFVERGIRLRVLALDDQAVLRVVARPAVDHPHPTRAA